MTSQTIPSTQLRARGLTSCQSLHCPLYQGGRWRIISAALWAGTGGLIVHEERELKVLIQTLEPACGNPAPPAKPGPQASASACVCVFVCVVFIEHPSCLLNPSCSHSGNPRQITKLLGGYRRWNVCVPQIPMLKPNPNMMALRWGLCGRLGREGGVELGCDAISALMKGTPGSSLASSIA